MAPATTGGGLSVVTERRLALAGQPGLKGLVSNLHTLSIAVFASIGGLVYGYNQGKSPSIQFGYSSDYFPRINRHVWSSALDAQFHHGLWRDWYPEPDTVRPSDIDLGTRRLGRCTSERDFGGSTWPQTLRCGRLLLLLHWCHCPSLYTR